MVRVLGRETVPVPFHRLVVDVFYLCAHSDAGVIARGLGIAKHRLDLFAGTTVIACVGAPPRFAQNVLVPEHRTQKPTHPRHLYDNHLFVAYIADADILVP